MFDVKILAAASLDFMHPALIDRARIAATSEPDMLLFRVLEHGEECSFVALRDEDAETIELEEIFVISEFRGHDLGAKIIDGVIDICRELGKRRVIVWAHPLDDDDDDDDAKRRLIAWYERCGFTQYNAWDELERWI